MDALRPAVIDYGQARERFGRASRSGTATRFAEVEILSLGGGLEGYLDALHEFRVEHRRDEGP